MAAPHAAAAGGRRRRCKGGRACRFRKQGIYDYAWDDIYIGEDKTINVHVSNIRKKLRQYTEEEYIETVWGIGFRLSRA